MPMPRRHFLALTAAAALPVPRAAAEGGPEVQVYTAPGCGCCTAWVAHLEAEGFSVAARELEAGTLQTLKARAGLAPAQRSCHTAVVEGYVIEGHVPAADIRRLLAERPAARGLTVPGMPIGSPGMEMGATKEPYDTLLLRPDGGTEIFASHR